MSAKKKKTPDGAAATLRIKVRLGENILGPGKLRLLALIDDQGSISAAAREMGIRYRRAQFLLKTLQEGFAEPLVTTRRGRGETGGAALTDAGRALLERHSALEADLGARAAPFLDWLETRRTRS